MESKDDERATEESGAHPQEQAASELSDRSAESVSRRYDATKESVHEERHETGDEDEDEDARG